MVRQRSLNLVIVSAFVLLVVCGPASAVDVNGLAAHWALDEGSGTIAYDSAGDNDGTLIGGPVWTSGQVGGALDFDGVDDYVDCGTGLALSEVTVSAWVNTSEGGGQIVFSKKGQSSGGHEAYCLATGDLYGTSGVGTVSTRIKQPGTVSFIDLATTERVDDGEWHFIAMSYDGTIAKIYIDGEVKATSPPGSAIYYSSYTESARIGASTSTDGLPYAFFNGVIDEVMVFERALSGEEVEDLYWEGVSNLGLVISDVEEALVEKESALGSIDAAVEREWEAYDALAEMLLSGDYEGLSKRDIAAAQRKVESAIMREERSKGIVLDSIAELEEALLLLGVEPEPNEPEPDPNLVAHWAFDEGSGTIAYDSAGDSDGTVYGASWTSGQIDGALEFDGLDDYVDCGTGAALTGTGPFSASAWVQTDTAKGQKIVGQRSETTADGSYGVSILDDGRVQLQIYNSGYGFLFQSSVTVDDGLWHHVAAIRTNSTDGEIYVDGSLVGSGTGPVKSLNSVPVSIARGFTGPFYFDGKIDDVRIYDRALSGAEVEQLYLSGL